MAQVPPPPAVSAPPGPPPLEPLPRKRRSRRWWFAVPIALFVYLLLVLITLVQPVSVAGLSLTVPIPGLSPARLFGLPDRPFTVVIVGLDIRPTQDGPSRTDSILLLRIDPAKNRAGILSIPRDSMMQVPLADGGLVEDRVNTAFVYNWSPDDPGQAPAALARTIEHNLGLEVDHYIIFDQRGAARIIDAGGGVTVVVREAFGQENYSDDDVHVVPQFFPEGKQRLTGYQAVAYGRIREGSSDLDRIRRQQQVAEGLVAQLSSPRNVWRLPGVWGAYREAMETDLSLRQSAGVFVFLKRIGTSRIVTRSLGDAAVSCYRCAGALLQLQPEETARLISEAFDDDAAGQAAAELLVAAGVTP
jgi:LCP family protein required for cell wall assembly